MRWVVLAGMCAMVLAACGDGDESSLPAAATDTTAQVATVTTSAAASGSASGEPGSGDAASDDGTSGRAESGPLRGTYKRLNGEPDDLAGYRGKVVLVVNTATACGYTPQFEGLEALYRDRRKDGLVVLGFPANDFAGQEPRSDEEIATFCKANYGVSFPMFAKTHVVGEHANALFRRLSAAAGAPEWNFNKYLVDRRGKVVARFGAGTEPDDVELVGRVSRLL
jgi:glutathione peroxidase